MPHPPSQTPGALTAQHAWKVVAGTDRPVTIPGSVPDLSLTASYEYSLPEELIAVDPAEQRSNSRLLVIEPDGSLVHGRFCEVIRWLDEGDVLVRNVSRVVPARLEGRKRSGGQVGLLVLEVVESTWDEPGPTRFLALYNASRPPRVGTEIDLVPGQALHVVERKDGGHVVLETRTHLSLMDLLEQCGQVPLPPYIVRRRRALMRPVVEPSDRVRYQTVYARDPGAVAAPTAGLHFTDEIFEDLSRRGIELVDLSLDVGAGTFKPIGEEHLDQHKLHAERYHLPALSAERINAALAQGRRIVAVGTTVLRALEDQAVRGVKACHGHFETNLFIRPGVPCRWVGALITNFHLPRSSLLTLVCAFGGYTRVMAAYREAIARSYRFYSYGDAMFLTRQEV